MIRSAPATAGLILGVFVTAGALSQPQPKFFPDDPLVEDNDSLPVPMPAPRDLSQILDFALSNFFLRPQPSESVPEAHNINTLGEVPDSSWFENRIGRQPWTVDQLRRGPDRLDDVDLSSLTLTSAKLEGVTPGFFAVNDQGQRFLIKFDPRDYPRMATAAEIISTKFFHAFGYRVPENYLGWIDPEQVAIDPDASVEENGVERPINRNDLKRIIDRIASEDPRRVRVVASRFLEGRPLGPFRYHGTRSDDPNDIFPHQHRRELRGLRVFASWLNHDDSRAINTLTMYVGDSPGGYVRHHLIDFGSTLGSGSVKPQSRRAGNEYMIEWSPILKAALTLGLWDRSWRGVDYGDFPSVGRFEGDYFQPELWRPEYPNPAFERMRLDDAFWAVRILARFDEESVRAIVETGRLGDPEAEDWVVRALMKRHRKILDFYLSRLNPLHEFRVEGDSLHFDNLGESTGVAQARHYEWEWFEFDNLTRQSTPIGQASSTEATSLPIPTHPAEYLEVRIKSLSDPMPAWNEPVVVYLRRGSPRSVVGVDRPGTEEAFRY